MNEAEFLQRLREAFAIEADEHFRTMSKCLTDLDHLDADGRQGVIELIFREAHSLKGAARAINRSDIETLCQSMESMFAQWKRDPRSATRGQIDLTAQAVDLLAEMLASDVEYSVNDGAVPDLVESIKEQCCAKTGDAPERFEAALPSPVAGTDIPITARNGNGMPLRSNDRFGPGEDFRSSPTPAVRQHDHTPPTTHSTGMNDAASITANIESLLSATRRQAGPDALSESSRTDSDRNAADVAIARGDDAGRNSTAAAASGTIAGANTAGANTTGANTTGANTTGANAAGEIPAGKEQALVGAGSAMRSVKDTIRVPISELESLYRQTEELSSVKFMLGRHAADLRRVIDQCREWIREYNKQRQGTLEEYEMTTARAKDADFHAGQHEKLQNFMKWTARQIEGIESAVGKNLEDGRGTMYILESMSDSMMDDAKQLLLMPFTMVTDPLPAMVRKIARDLKKDVRFRIEGEDIRIDKRILEAMKDPLLHLLRNSLDHGIEDAAQRAGSGKPITGSIRLAIQMAADSRIEVLLEDDGRGIDVGRVKRKAIEDGLLTEEKALKLTEKDALELVFLSGITTSPIITDLSGRGVGLNVVRENIIALGGEIDIETTQGGGTKFRISLPLSLSNARGVLVRSQGKLYVVPLQFVERGLSIHRENFSQLDGKTVMDYHGRTVTVRRLEEMLSGAAAKRDERPQSIVLLLRLTGHMIAVEVDEILWEQDVVIKPLPAPIGRVRTVSGATLLGTGELVLVLQVPDLFDAARKSFVQGRSEVPTPSETRRQRLLVVDDSITSRVLLHDILVSSGFEVKTAVDGIDALTHMREEQFDLIVSDVEMPRMNGFELTEAVRKDEKLRETPLVLVTGLESQEDRERGFDVGANAYITKSSFDQSNLIDVIERLI